MSQQHDQALEQQLQTTREQLAQLQLQYDHLIGSIPGGGALYTVEGGRLVPLLLSDGVCALTGHTRQEYERLLEQDHTAPIYAPDLPRLIQAGRALFDTGVPLDACFRVRRKDGTIGWIRLCAHLLAPVDGRVRIFAVFTNLWMESSLYQSIIDETADGVYVIDKQTFELLYVNESTTLFVDGGPSTGRPCHVALHGLSAPCPFCPLHQFGADGKTHEIIIPKTGRTYAIRIRPVSWNDIPAYISYVRDVTDEVNTRREKERLEIFFKTIVDALPGGISVLRLDPDGTAAVEYVSSGFAAMLGISADRLVQMDVGSFYDLIHPDDTDGIRTGLQAFFRNGSESCTLKGRMRQGEGHICVECKLSMRATADGVRRAYAVYTDITHTIRENERLRRQYEDMLLQHYSTPGPNELMRGHCNITQDHLLQMKDFTNSGLIERLDGDWQRERFFLTVSSYIVDEQERQAFTSVFLRAPALAAFARGVTEVRQTCFLSLPGLPGGCYAQIQMRMLETPGTGDLTGVLTVTDATDHVLSERILNQLSITTHDYIVDVDLRADSFKVRSSSKTAFRAPPETGCHSARTAYMAEQVVVPADRAHYRQALDANEIVRRLQTENAYTVTYSLTDETGGVRTKNMTVFAIDLRLRRVCLVCTDITESVGALESALTLAKEANRAKSDFLATMSHDIRTPMNAITGMTTLALACLDDRTRVENCLQKIQVANKHLLSLVNDVLDMSRIERSQIVMHLRPLSLSALIDEIATIIEPQAKEAGLAFIVRKTGVQQDAFLGDSLRINQILINLLSNAVKFTRTGGRVELTVEQRTPADAGTRIHYRFTVRDTGVGISPDFIRRVFYPFARETTALRVEGTGLGLSITKGLVEQMHGTITVESELNRGSVFRVDLAFAPAPPAAAPGAPDGSGDTLPPCTPFDGRTFLVAEDNAINAELLCELLHMEGARTVLAADGEQAVRTMQSAAPGAFDAVLMDIQMPLMTGYAATRAIRELRRPDAKTVPIIAMTANAFAEDVQAALDAGMNAHVSKPIDMDLLRATLCKILAGEPAAP